MFTKTNKKIQGTYATKFWKGTSTKGNTKLSSSVWRMESVDTEPLQSVDATLWKIEKLRRWSKLPYIEHLLA